MGQSASGLLAPNRYIDWSQAGATLPTGTIPNCATQPATGSVANITAAFNADKGGASYCVINIPSGTVTESSSLILSYAGNANVILRGAGPNSTVLKFTGTSTTCFGIGATAVCSYNGSATAFGYSPDTCSITSGVAQGSTSVTFGSWPGSTFVPSYTGCSLSDLHVGSLIQITQQDDGTTDTGNIWMHGNGPSGTSAWETWGGASNSWVPNFTTAGNPGRSLSQNVKVTGISGSTVTFSPALYAPTWNQSKVPYASFANILPLSNFGIENLTIDTSSLGDNEAMLNSIWNKNTWVKNVRFVAANVNYGTGTSRKHVLVNSSSHMTIRDSYFFGSAGASDGYGVDLSWGTSDSLVENNIFQHISTGTITENGSGNVFGYNYAVDNYFNNGDPGWQQCDAFHHDAGDHFNLWEGHEGICAVDDDFHGPSFGITHFRSYFSGFDPANTCPAGASCGTISKNQNVTAYMDMGYNRYENFVLNVIGSSNTTGYQNVGASANNGSGVMTNCPSVPWFIAYSLNYSDQNQLAFTTQSSGTNCLYYSTGSSPASFNLDNDPLTSQSLVRWGNYDTVNAAVRTNSGETGSTAPVYPGLNSPSTTWGSYKSLYLSAQPSWWGSMPWPAVGPDVTGGNIANVGGHAYHNPAANCYLNVMGGATNGSSAALPFDAASCYSTTSVAAPTFSPSPGAYGSTQSVTLATTTSGAAICFTIDGSTPTASSGSCTHGTTYSAPVSVAVTTTFRAIASIVGLSNSTESGATYTINGAASAPTFAPVAGSYGPTQSVSLSTATTGATICYTVDGSTPTANGSGTCTHGTTYSTAISVASSETIKAIASKAAFNDSSVASAAYVINGAASTPTFSPVAGSYGGTQSVTITSSTSGATICYTTNGATPAASSPGTCAVGSTQYTSPVSVASSLTVKAIATKVGWSDSPVGTAAYTINGTVATPTFSPVGGGYGPAQSVTIASTTSGATICYTTDGSTPTTDGAGTCTHGTTYAGAVTVSTSETLTAIASKSTFADSAVSSASYIINGALPAPVISPAAGSYGSAQTISISAVSGSAVTIVNAMQETSNANDTIGSTVHRNTYTNCATGYNGSALTPVGQPVGNLYCTSSDKTAALANGGPNLGVVTSTISGTGTSALDNGNGAGGSDSPTTATATYAGATGTACGAHGSSASGFVSGLTFPDPGANAQLVYGLTTGSSGNSSILTVSKYNSNGDSGRYVAQRDCFTPNSVSVGGAHYESDYNYNTSGGTYLGFGKDYDFPTKMFRAAPQGASWINEELCPVAGGACITTFTIPSGDSLLIESYEHWDSGCTYSSSTACAYYDAIGLQLYNAGSPVGSMTYYNVRNASTHGVISFIPINKTSWTHPQYAIQHQWDINATSATLSATVPFSTAVAYYSNSGFATICYTTDGTTPTADGAGTCTHGTTYAGPFTVSTSQTVKAISSQSGYSDSSAASAAYTINGTAATPTFSPVAGTYATTQSVTISSSTAGATLCYTTDGSTPTADGNGTCTHGTTYSTAVSISASLTLQAVASKAGFTDSPVGSAAYVISSPSAPKLSGVVTISGGATIQ